MIELGFDKDLFLCACYFPSEHSNPGINLCEKLEQDILHLPDDSYVIITGNLNSRMDHHKDYNYARWWQSILKDLFPENTQLDQVNMDSSTNTYGQLV